MIVDGYRSFYTEEELKTDGFNDRMLAELLGAPDDELAKQPDMPPVEGHVWAALKVERAKEKAIDEKMRSQSDADDSTDEWEPPEGFLSIKQVRALGFTKRRRTSCSQSQRMCAWTAQSELSAFGAPKTLKQP